MMQIYLPRRRVTAAAWQPSDETGLVGWYVADTANLFQDDPPTTPVTTNGDPIAHFVDLSSENNHLIQATTVNQPFYKTGGFSDADGSADYLLDTIATSWDVSTAGYCVGIRFEDPGTYTSGTTGFMLGNSSQANNGGVKIKRTSASIENSWFDGTNAYTASISGFFSQSTNLSVLVYSDNANDLIYIKDNSNENSVASATRLTNTIDRFSLHSRQGGGEASAWPTRAVVVYNNELDPTARANLLAYLDAL